MTAQRESIVWPISSTGMRGASATVTFCPSCIFSASIASGWKKLESAVVTDEGMYAEACGCAMSGSRARSRPCGARAEKRCDATVASHFTVFCPSPTGMSNVCSFLPKVTVTVSFISGPGVRRRRNAPAPTSFSALLWGRVGACSHDVRGPEPITSRACWRMRRWLQVKQAGHVAASAPATVFAASSRWRKLTTTTARCHPSRSRRC